MCESERDFSMSEELKPCPFCGADPDISVQEDDTEDTYYVVACTNCNMAHSSSDDENVAIRNWNDRPIEDAQAARIAELEAERDRLRKALKRVIKLLDRPMLKDDMCLYMNKAIRVAHKALEEQENVEKNS